MGAILDSAKNLWKNKKNPSRQAYKDKEKLEKDKDKGVKMIPAVADLKTQEPIKFTLVYRGKLQQFIGEELDITVFGGLEQKAIFVTPRDHSKLNGKVPDEIRPEIESELQTIGYNKKPTYPK